MWVHFIIKAPIIGFQGQTACVDNTVKQWPCLFSGSGIHNTYHYVYGNSPSKLYRLKD